MKRKFPFPNYKHCHCQANSKTDILSVRTRNMYHALN